MTVSIAMATFNGASHLQAQLDSFTRQTRVPDELVVCDDGSTDATIPLLQGFREAAGFRVSIHRNASTLGYARNFEQALSMCGGDIIFLSDQDDVWMEGKVATMTALLQRPGAPQVLIADMVLADAALTPSRFTQLGNILALGMPEASYVAGCATAMRKGWLDLVLPLPVEIVTHDNWIHRLAMALGVREVLRTPQQFYRRHEANASLSPASAPQRVSALRSAVEHGLGDATLAWEQELERVRATRVRIGGAGAVLAGLGLLARQAGALQRLDAHAAAISARIRACRNSRLRRLPAVLAMWARGDYSHFSGSRSAIKDALRP